MGRFEGEYLDYDEVTELLGKYRPWLAKTYVSAMNMIHYMHDKYAYEKTQMALHDTNVHPLHGIRNCRTFRVLADSLFCNKVCLK